MQYYQGVVENIHRTIYDRQIFRLICSSQDKTVTWIFNNEMRSGNVDVIFIWRNRFFLIKIWSYETRLVIHVTHNLKGQSLFFRMSNEKSCHFKHISSNKSVERYLEKNVLRPALYLLIGAFLRNVDGCILYTHDAEYLFLYIDFQTSKFKYNWSKIRKLAL